MEPLHDFANRLRNIRHIRHLSQADVARRMGLQPSAISHFEAGKRTPSLKNLKRLAVALATSTDYLLGFADPYKTAGLLRGFEKLTDEQQGVVVALVGILWDKAHEKTLLVNQ